MNKTLYAIIKNEDWGRHHWYMREDSSYKTKKAYREDLKFNGCSVKGIYTKEQLEEIERRS